MLLEHFVSSPRFSPGEAIHFDGAGLDLLLRIVRVTVEGHWVRVIQHTPPDEDLEPASDTHSHRTEYTARVLNIDDAGGRSLRPGQLVTFGAGPEALATADALHEHGRAMDLLPSEHEIRGNEARRAFLDEAKEDVAAQYLLARKEGVLRPMVLLQRMQPGSYQGPGPRGVDLVDRYLQHREFDPRSLPKFDGAIPDGRFPVVVLLHDVSGESYETLPIPPGNFTA